MDTSLSVAVYGYCGSSRLDYLLWTVRNLGGSGLEVVVTQDRDGNPAEAARYERVCAKYDAKHNALSEHMHMAGCCNEAVNATTGEWVLVCSEDVLVPRGLIPMLQHFLHDNQNSAFLDCISGMFLFHYDRDDIDNMANNYELDGLDLDFRCKTGFYATAPESDAWWWKTVGFQLPPSQWGEQTPFGMVSCCSNVHGAMFVVRRKYWDAVNGCANAPVRENDSVISFRLGHWTDGTLIRLPFLPAVAHYGGASPNPPDHERWANTIPALIRQHGGEFDGEMSRLLITENPQDALVLIERGLKIRAYSMQSRFRHEIAALDYSYKDV